MGQVRQVLMGSIIAVVLALALASALRQSAAGVFASASGLSFSVNSPADVPDKIIDGKCETEVGNHTCTLRAAIQEANAQPGSDIISIGAMTVTLMRAEYDDTALSGDLDIIGLHRPVRHGAELRSARLPAAGRRPLRHGRVRGVAQCAAAGGRALAHVHRPGRDGQDVVGTARRGGEGCAAGQPGEEVIAMPAP